MIYESRSYKMNKKIKFRFIPHFQGRAYWLTNRDRLCSDGDEGYGVLNLEECKLAASYIQEDYFINNKNTRYTSDWTSPVVPRGCMVAFETGKVYLNTHEVGHRHPNFTQVCRSKGK